MQIPNEGQTAIRAELTAAAAKAGVVDVADLAHVDVSALSDAGSVAAFVEGLRTTKPHWFATPKMARDMTPAEYAEAKAAFRQYHAAPEPIAGGAHVRDLTEAEFRAVRLRLTGRRW